MKEKIRKKLILLLVFGSLTNLNQLNSNLKNIGKGSMFFNKDIIKLTLENNFFRKEVVTGPHSQVVLMNIPVGEDIGEEVHRVDQTLIFVSGSGQAILNGEVSEISKNHLVFVPAGTKHNFKNTGKEDLKLYTIYAPAQHKPGTVEETKTEYED